MNLSIYNPRGSAVADDDDLFADLEAEIESEDSKEGKALRKYWKHFVSSEPPADEGGIPLEPAGSDLQVVEDAFDPDDEERAQAVYDYDAKARGLSLRGFLQRFALIGLMASLAGLYTQWIYLLKDTEDFHFVLGNTWPTILFGGMLFGLCIEQVLSWIGRQALALWQWWRFNMFFSRWRAWRRAPRWQHTYCCCWRCKHNKQGLTRHFNHCCCAHCKLKRRWTYWKRLERYPKGWKEHSDCM